MIEIELEAMRKQMGELEQKSKKHGVEMDIIKR